MFVLNIIPQKGHWYGLLLLCTRHLWFCKVLDSLKFLLHSEHLYGLSPVWTLMCLFRFPDWLNTLSHLWHLYGLSPLWILLCWMRPSDLVNRLLQTVHSNGFSPEWLRMCLASLLLFGQHMPHSVHLCLLVWIFIWLRRLLWDEKHLPHNWLQGNNSSAPCTFLWTVNLRFDVNHLSQSVHRYAFSRWCNRLAFIVSLWNQLSVSVQINTGRDMTNSTNSSSVKCIRVHRQVIEILLLSMKMIKVAQNQETSMTANNIRQCHSSDRVQSILSVCYNIWVYEIGRCYAVCGLQSEPEAGQR